MNCTFEQQDNRLVCTRCGASIKYIPGRVLRNCGTPDMSSSAAEKLELPSLMEQAGNLVTDAVKWAASGFQTNDQAEMERRLDICRSCDKFTGSRCSECGCQCNWASWLKTKECPLGKWEKKEEHE